MSAIDFGIGTATGELVLSYKMGIKYAIMNALRKLFASGYPDTILANKVKVISDYPLEEIEFPVIVIRFQPGRLENRGIGHYELAPVNGQDTTTYHWIFDGRVSFEVYAKTPADRDMIITGLTNIFAFGDHMDPFQDFRIEIDNSDFIVITLGFHSLQEEGDNIGTVPWGDDATEKVYTDGLSMPVFGEFYTNPHTGGLVRIVHVQVNATIENPPPPLSDI